MRKKVVSWLLLVSIIGVVFSAVVFSQTSVHADDGDEQQESGLGVNLATARKNAYFKALYRNLILCESSLIHAIPYNELYGGGSVYNIFEGEGTYGDYIKIPFDYYSGNAIVASSANCGGLIDGWKTDGLLDKIFGDRGDYTGTLFLNADAVVPDGTATSMYNFLENVGYVKKEEGTGDQSLRCFYILGYFEGTVDPPYHTPDYCVKVDDSGKIDANENMTVRYGLFTEGGYSSDDGHLDEKSSQKFFPYNSGGGGTFPRTIRIEDGNLKWSVDSIYLPSFRYSEDESELSDFPNAQMTVSGFDFSSSGVDYTFSELMNKAKSNFQNLKTTNSVYVDGFGGWQEDKNVFTKVEAVETNPTITSYVFERAVGQHPFVEYFLLDTSLYNGGRFNEAEKYALYYTYLSDIYKVQLFDYETSDTVRVPWINESTGDFSYRWVSCPNSDTKVYVLNSSDMWGTDLEQSDCLGVANRIKDINVEVALNAVESIVDPSLGPEEEGSVNTEPDPCHDGAGSLGWLVCPLLTKMAEGATWVYEQILAPFLEVNVALVSRDSGTYNAWGVMLNISNTVLIAYFLVIIFSQLTGIGIDNYGIKKTLPKVIVVAVLINLSFLICQILVDLSNIIGNSAVQLMTNIPVTLPEGAENAAAIAAPGSEWFSILIYAAAGGMLGVGALALVTAFTSNSGGGIAGILMPLILAILTALLAVIFFFALLGLRKAGIVLLVVLSPLAIVCYMLPNTKQYFDKWKKAFQGLLLVYPICGLVIGGGQFVSKLIITVSADQMMVLTALVVMVAPFFFVPSLLKGSFKAFGNLGAKVSGFGANLRGKATNSAKNSSLVKKWQDSSTRGATRRRAGVNKDGSVRDLNKFQRLVRGGTRNVAAARSQYLADQEKNRRERNLIGAGLDAELASMRSKVEDQDVANAKAMLVTGAAKTNDGKAVNTSDAKSLGQFHKESLERYRNARSDNERRRAMANVKAAQSLLSGTDAGRSEIQNNLEEAVANGNTAGLAEAAGHLQGSYGDLYKAKNRGANALITDLATAERDSNNEISSEAVTGMQNKMSRYAYDAAGTSKYTQESLANADDQALRRMQNALSIKGAVSQKERQNIISTAQNAMKMYDEGKLSVKPEARQYLEQIANMGTSPSNNNNPGRGDTAKDNASMGNDEKSNSDANNDVKPIINSNNKGTNAGSGDDNSVLNVRTPSGIRTPVVMSTDQVNNFSSGDKLVNSVTPVMQGTSTTGSDSNAINLNNSGGIRTPVAMSTDQVNNFSSGDKLVNSVTPVVQGASAAGGNNVVNTVNSRLDVQKPVVPDAPSKIIVGNAAEDAFNAGRRNGDIKLPSGPRPK